ncbi:tol-pal system protein YbgF [Amaricoccus sp.]|uniref:tol-pal system protein YbgF n=1 Tax=Amaricoccus sp. TaxID=1872485 RepID=UPI001B6E4BDC|nr:tol-pal system protein YbgF [Amaricoccus sp.]MBP7242804.1 tol-pal system protein YbgF [Amaricoccus sp.]
MRGLVVALGLVLAAVGPAAAQQAPALSAGQTLGDVRADLDVLNRQIAELRRALVAAGTGKGLPTASATALTRLDQLEAELRRLTNRVDVLTNDVNRIVADATNRAGDIEFRLTELEGGDVSALGAPEPLGGGVTPPAPAPTPPAAAPTGTGELAVSEQADFDAAVAAAEAGDNARAATLFEAFVAAYPGGPLAAEAQFRRGEALAANGDQRGAARAFLDAFSGAPEGPVAPKALLRLAGALGALGQTNEACLTLGEVTARYPGSEAAGQVPGQKQVLACP